jgi:hypothetical protein
MTPAEEVARAAEVEDEAEIRRLIAPLSEPERADLIPLARDLVAVQVARRIDAARHLGPMLLLAYGTLAVTEIRKLGWRSNHVPRDLVDVLRGRSPERLGPIVDYLLESVGGARAWRAVRPLVREGIVPRPDSPAYTIAMLSGAPWRDSFDPMADDPGLVDVEIWRLFEVEGGGEDSLANYEKFHGDHWGNAFRELAEKDASHRARLLDASLAALGRDFSTYRAGWFSRFHESLVPSDEERAQRTAAYLGLLRSRVGPTVSFAIAALTRIERAGLLGADDVLDRIGPVLSEGPVGTAKAALDLVGRAAAKSSGDAGRAALLAVDALRHPSPDVQRAAIALIGKLCVTSDVAVAAAIEERLPEVAASQRATATALAARLRGDATTDAAAAPTPARFKPAPERPSASDGPHSPTEPSRTIEPLTTVESLVDAAVSVLETGEPADDIERVLDGVRRHADVRAGASARLIAPIAKRARTLLARRDSQPFNGFDAQSDVAAVLLAWSAGEVVDSAPSHPSFNAGAGAFLSTRAQEAAEHVANGRAEHSVALPTHRGGWIEPAVLVTRLADARPVSSLDFVAAILRLAPDGRAEALDRAAGLDGEEGAVVRYALGGREPVGRTPGWWVAAARVRSPGADDEAVDKRHPRLGPEAAHAARLNLRITRPKGTYERLSLGVQPPPRDRVAIDLPTALMLRDPSSFGWLGRSSPAMFRWMATIQPGYREVWAAIGSLLIGRNVDWWSAEWGNRAFLEPFLDPWTALGPHALQLLGIALGAKEAGERGLATDVGRLAIAEDRLDADGLARGLAATVSIALDRPQRWALSLADVAAESDRHAGVVADGIGAALSAIAGRPPRSLVPLLRLVDELLAGTGRPLSAEARPTLEALAKSGGQAGRLPRSILAR